MILLYITIAVFALPVAWIFLETYVEIRSFEMYEEMRIYDVEERNHLWKIIRSANRRRKKVERYLARERRRTDVWVRQPRYGRMADQITKLEQRNRELAATIVESILNEEKPVADVLVDRLRKKGP